LTGWYVAKTAALKLMVMPINIILKKTCQKL